MSKDQTYGFLILVISVIVTLVYLFAITAPVHGLVSNPGFWYSVAVGLPVLLAVLIALGILGWIGYTMMTTPPPAPLEDITSPPAESKGEQRKGT